MAILWLAGDSDPSRASEGPHLVHARGGLDSLDESSFKHFGGFENSLLGTLARVNLERS